MRWLLLPLLLAPALGAAENPRIELDPEHQMVLTSLPPILADEEVKEHLTTGLTTTITLRPRGKVLGGALVEIRYDLWDEVFHVAAVGFGSRTLRAELPTFEDLAEWWRELRLRFLDGSRLGHPWPRELEVTARVVPFSQSEEDDTQRWFSESIEHHDGTDALGRSSEKQTETLQRTFNLLLATSIRRRPLAAYTWTVTLPPLPQQTPGERR